MNPIQILSSQPWVERLGWTLVHFFWQGLLLAALYAAARRYRATSWSPNARYLLAGAAMAAMVAAPLVTWCLLGPGATIPDSAYRVHASFPSASASIVTNATPLHNSPAVAQPAQFLPWVVIAWLGGALAFWVRLAGGWVVAARMRSMLVRPAPPEWQQVLARLGARIGLTRPVRLLVSALVQVPTVVGWLRPVVLVPVGALVGLPAEHLEALLVHELAHIRRHDYLVNILQSIAEALLFYHPAVWWVSGHLRNERELCCDDVAVSTTGDVLTYARALLEWESCRPAYLHAAVAANGGSLAARIARLLGQSAPAAPAALGPGVLTVALLLVGAVYGVFAQTAVQPAFQVASVKRNTETAPRGMMVRPQPGGRLVARNAPLRMLIQNAYTVHAFQVVGGPAWINSEGYDIEAKPEGDTHQKQMWLMLQTLLADRFKLAVHRDTKELPLYALSVTKGGLKQPPPNPGGCVALDPEAASSLPPSSPGPCGRAIIAMSPAGVKMEGSKVPMGEVVRVLSTMLGSPVADKTGITGELDVHLDFTPDDATMGLPGSGGAGDPGGPRLPTDSNRPNIFAALQEQLGLKLTPGKGPVDVLVIDHVERPAAN